MSPAVKLVAWQSLIIAIVGVVVSGAVALAVAGARISSLEEQVTVNTTDLREMAPAMSAMTADIRWIVVTLDDIRVNLNSIRRQTGKGFLTRGKLFDYLRKAGE